MIIKSNNLKYTTRELINNVIEKEKIIIDNNQSLTVVSKKYGIEIKVLQGLMKHPKVLSYEMYKAISIILKKDIKELTTIEKIEIKPNYRTTKISKEEGTIKENLILANNIFDEIISIKRLRG